MATIRVPDMGSSPRMRGAHKHLGEGGRIDGIIPAYAGSTFKYSPYIQERRDHPRVCGEHFCAFFDDKGEQGSSPRMRGAHYEVLNTNAPFGIIPAYAGSTKNRTGHPRSIWDHPRVCGEHGDRVAEHKRRPGSSPRMRGALAIAAVVGAIAGIIPAYAGSTKGAAP